MKSTFFLSFILSLLILTGCSTENDSIMGTEGIVSESESTLLFEGNITAPEVLDMESTSLTRVRISDDNAPKFGWYEGMEMPVFVLFRKGADVNGEKAMRSGKLTIKTIQADGRWKYKMTVPTPAGFNPNQTDIYASAVIGATMIDNTGNVKIAAPATITDNAAGIDYQIPMYFPMTKVEKWNFIQANFEMYGSLLAVKLTVDLFEGYKPSQLELSSSAFRLGGTMNVNTGVGAAPTWTPDAATTNLIALSNFSYPPSTVSGKTIYVWMKPEAVGGTVTATVRDATYMNEADLTLKNRFNRTTTSAITFVDGKSYRMPFTITSDLIFTEYYHSTLLSGTYNWIEIYNPTNHDIMLADYSLVKANSGGNVATLALKDLATLSSQIYNSSNYTDRIPAGKLILLAANIEPFNIYESEMQTYAYQIFHLGNNDAAVRGNATEAHYITKGGTAIANIVDNMGWDGSSFQDWDAVSHYRNEGLYLNRTRYNKSEWGWRGLTKVWLGRRTNPALSNM